MKVLLFFATELKSIFNLSFQNKLFHSMSGKRNKCWYSTKWEDTFKWIQPDSNKENAFCKLCNRSFKIDGSGVTQVKSHEKSKDHKEREKSATSQDQRRFTVNASSVNMTTGNIVLTNEEKIIKAEILQALKCVESNYSFNSASDDSERFKLMFPDSHIAQNYQQGKTKIMYNIQFGIAPYVKEMLIFDINNRTPFTFKFDETTTSQIQKQYDGYIQFWSKKRNRVESRYCGSLFVGHCKTEDLIEHFKHSVDKMKWNLGYLLHLGMDGPAVNLSFQTRLTNTLFENNKVLLDIGTCCLHMTHNGFSKGLHSLDFNLEQFIVDLNSFFKLSSARHEDYTLLAEITQLPAHFFLTHSSIRWVTLKKVALRNDQHQPILSEVSPISARIQWEEWTEEQYPLSENQR